MPRITPVEAGGKNVCAFLDMIAASEGTCAIPGSDDGYRAIVGGSVFQSYADHPRVLVDLPRLNIKSTAAGRYQLLARYWDAYRKLLGLPDFSPRSQDLIAVQQIREQKALSLIRVGNFASAVQACAHIWASLPGAGYGQREQKLSTLADVYKQAGGTIA